MTEEPAKQSGKSQVVYLLTSSSRCHACDRKLEPGEIVKLEDAKDDREALCKQCAKLDRLKFVPKGNARVTKMATSFSKTKFVVMQWSHVWKCYERQGVLVEEEALAKAEREAKSD